MRVALNVALLPQTTATRAESDRARRHRRAQIIDGHAVSRFGPGMQLAVRAFEQWRAPRYVPMVRVDEEGHG